MWAVVARPLLFLFFFFCPTHAVYWKVRKWESTSANINQDKRLFLFSVFVFQLSDFTHTRTHINMCVCVCVFFSDLLPLRSVVRNYTSVLNFCVLSSLLAEFCLFVCQSWDFWPLWPWTVTSEEVMEFPQYVLRFIRCSEHSWFYRNILTSFFFNSFGFANLFARFVWDVVHIPGLRRTFCHLWIPCGLFSRFVCQIYSFIFALLILWSVKSKAGALSSWLLKKQTCLPWWQFPLFREIFREIIWSFMRHSK